MGKKRKKKAAAPVPTAPDGSVQPDASAPPVEGEIRLLVPRLNAHRVMCPAGTVIAPNVDGWPDARVGLHLRHGHAEVVQISHSEQDDTTHTEAGAAE
ncbi:MAG: hypothetical protein H8K09_13070 [Nitrospira sp.]|nr:hypothetical protein [Nitrospira sp.]